MKKIINIPIPSYPWIFVPSPLATAFNEEEKIWLDTDYTYMSEESIQRYKQQNIVKASTYMSPTTTSKDQFRPIARFLIYETMFDDYVGIMPLEEVAVLRDRAFEVMVGADPDPSEIGMFRQMAAARKEWLENGMPSYWIERNARNFYNFVTYGIMEETSFKLTGTYPSLGRFNITRAYSVGQIAYVDLVEPATDYALPDHIYYHPVMQRIVHVQAIIIGIQNDFASLRKELASEVDTFNLILLLRDEHKLSLEEAIAKALQIHDDFVEEFESLAQGLPDFDTYQKAVENYVYHVKLMIVCLNVWYYAGGTTRYRPDGFVAAKYGKEEEIPTEVELRYSPQDSDINRKEFRI